MIDTSMLDALENLDSTNEIPEEQSNEQVKIESMFQNLPVVRERKVNSKGHAPGFGRRKSATASVWLSPGSGQITVNKQDFKEYFGREIYLHDIKRPFEVSGEAYDIKAVTKGGGKTGQSGALRLAISRALVNYNPEFYTGLRALGFMTFDNRRVERKKPGLVKARKAKPTSRR